MCVSPTFFFFVYPPADGEKKSSSSPHFHVFSYTLCVDLTQLHSQSSWFAGVSYGSRDGDGASCPYRRYPLPFSYLVAAIYLLAHSDRFPAISSRKCSNYLSVEFDNCRVDTYLCMLRDAPAARFKDSVYQTSPCHIRLRLSSSTQHPVPPCASHILPLHM